MCFERELKLPINLFRGSPPQKPESSHQKSEENNFVSQLRKKLNELHEGVRQQLELRSRKVKDLYDKNARRLFLKAGQKVWLFNPRRIKGRTPKL